MGQLASTGQLRASFLRIAIVTVPAILLLGSLSAVIAGSAETNPWFEALAKPDFMPPGWMFGAAWTLLYALMGLAAAIILHASGARGRGVALTLFLVQLALNLAWSPMFFAAHRVAASFWLIVVILVLAIATTIAFWRIRRVAGWLLLPYLAWLAFAGLLNHRIHILNPDAANATSVGQGVEMSLPPTPQR